MLFNSFQFLLFFPIVTLLYFLLPYQFRWFHLLVASCVFYMAFVPIYILILFFTIIIDYVAGILIENAAGSRRRLYLLMSIIANVGILVFFKYYNFLSVNINEVFHFVHVQAAIPLLNIVLPIGLSFHTFQAMSYTIEVYRSNQKPERHFGIYALYVMFYPQLVAGPIERPQNLLHQFHEPHPFNYDDFVVGMRRILWGLFKKAVIADRLSLIVAPIYKDPQHCSGMATVIGTVFFAFQIYCDFSGYSDIALGTARVMGFKLMVNFNKPYNAKSISEFWRKWHISLSSWLSDYVFNSMAVSLRNYGLAAVVISALVTFLVSGFWHGAAWKYIVWGALHGIAIAYELLTRKSRKKLFKKIPDTIGRIISVVLTFSYVCFTYIFFRANNVHDAVVMVKKVPGIFPEIAGIARHSHTLAQLLGGISVSSVLVGFGYILFLELVHKLEGKENITEVVAAKSKVVRWSLYFLVAGTVYLFGIFNSHQFIYFQF